MVAKLKYGVLPELEAHSHCEFRYRSEERRVGKESRSSRDWSSDVCSSDLGLSIVKHVAQNHGGEVKVWSTPGIGSTFTLRIPLLKNEVN